MLSHLDKALYRNTIVLLSTAGTQGGFLHEKNWRYSDLHTFPFTPCSFAFNLGLPDKLRLNLASFLLLPSSLLVSYTYRQLSILCFKISAQRIIRNNLKKHYQNQILRRVSRLAYWWGGKREEGMFSTMHWSLTWFLFHESLS